MNLLSLIVVFDGGSLVARLPVLGDCRAEFPLQTSADRDSQGLDPCQLGSLSTNEKLSKEPNSRN